MNDAGRNSTMLEAKPNDPTIEGGEHGEHVVREAAVLATIPVTGGQELKVVRVPCGLLALCSSSNVLVVGTVGDLAELTSALKALARTIGPEGGYHG